MGNNQHAQIAGLIITEFLKLSLSYTGHYLIAEFSQLF